MNQSSARWFSNLLLIGSLFFLSLATILGYIVFFQWNAIYGTYWLLIYYDEAARLFPLITIGYLFISIYFRLKSKRKKWKSNVAIVASIMALIISCIDYLPALFVGFKHLETLVVKNQVYHLAIRYSIADKNYFLFRCDRFDMNCRSILQSGDYTKVEKATLIYDSSSNKVKVEVGGEEIYSKSP